MGIEEDKKMEKSWDDTEKMVSDVICKKLRTLHIEGARRVGKRMSDRHDGSKQRALKHGRHTFLYSAMGELVCSGQLWARAALRQLRSYKVG